LYAEEVNILEIQCPAFFERYQSDPLYRFMFFSDYLGYVNNDNEDFDFTEVKLKRLPNPLLSRLSVEIIPTAKDILLNKWLLLFTLAYFRCQHDELCKFVSFAEYIPYIDDMINFSEETPARFPPNLLTRLLYERFDTPLHMLDTSGLFF